MPRIIDAQDLAAIDLGECIAAVDASGFDPRDEESFVSLAPVLKRLANNRSFLGDIAVDALKRGAAADAANGYGAQVIMLHRGAGPYFVRANLWPSPRDSVMKASGPGPFFYGVAHDHNFSFLTAGYLGPGYRSDYYEYDYGDVAGYPGEPVALRFVEQSTLGEGKVMLYRAHKDVHRQLPPERLSVSLNIMESTPGLPWRDQYRFDVERGTVEGILNRAAVEPLLALAAALGGGNGRDLVEHTAARHPSDRVRLRAVEALADAAVDPALRTAALEAGTRSPSRLVSGSCAAALKAMQP